MLTCLREAEALAMALDAPRQLGQIASFLAFHFSRLGAYDQAIAAARRARALALAGGDVILSALANRYLGETCHSQGDYRQAIDCFRQTVVSLDGARCYERFGQVFLPAVISRAYLAVCHAELGAFAEGRALGDEGLQIAAAVAHPASRMLASYGIGLLALRHGDLPRALPQLARAVGICQEADFPPFFPYMAAALGAAYTLAGRVTEAVPLLIQALEQATAAETRWGQTFCCLSLAEAQVLAGRIEAAQVCAERALALARTHQRGNEAYALRLLGDIAARSEPPEDTQAAAYYHQALVLADELGMRPLQAHCHRGLGILYSQTGCPEQTRAALSTAIELYWSMQMTFWLPQAEAMLSQVEISRMLPDCMDIEAHLGDD
jgi:tetratricopeptide (TPR) repeat protein